MSKKDYDKIHRTNMDVYARKIQAIYNSAVKEAASIGVTIHDFNPDKLFSFADYPITAARVEKLVKSLQNNIETVVLNGTEHEWTLSNNKNNELARRVFGDSIGKLSKIQEQRYFSNNLDALATFQKRKVTGLGLSQRVWKYTEQFKHEIELGIDIGLRDRLPATEIGRSLRDYLQNPDKLFRRVRDEHGVLKLSKAAKAFHPGQGVYRSSARNAERLARTETNMSYRTSDYERWQQFDFVVGIEIRRSNNRSYNCPLCDSLAGRYPKDFKFTGWHPQCRCHAVPVLKTIEELNGDTQRIIAGQPTDVQSVNAVNQMPDNFTNWANQNKDRFGASNTPYFLKDNEHLITPSSARLLDKTAAFTMTEQTVAILRSNGFALSDKVALSYDNSPMSGYDIIEFDSEFSKTLQKHHLNISAKSINLYKDETTFEYTYKFDEKTYHLERTFRIQDGVKCVHHDYFTLPESLQGIGISKETFRALYRQYQNSGISIIDVHANINIGGYTWAKYGFSANKQTALNIIDNSYLTSEIKKEARELVLQYNSIDGKFPMRLLAEQPYGKELLLKTSWNGTIDLRDAAQRDIFERYLFQ